MGVTAVGSTFNSWRDREGIWTILLSGITALPHDNEVKQFPQNLLELLIFL